MTGKQNGARHARMTARLAAAFAPEELVLRDVSSRHRGHAGWRGETAETHFEVEIKASRLQGLSRLEAHRLINESLAEEFGDNGLHALTIKLR